MERPGLKPDWVLEIRLFFSRNGLSRLAIMVSIVLHIHEVRDMGLYDCGSNFIFGWFQKWNDGC